MTDPQLFYLAVCGLYLAECATLVRKDTVVLAAAWGKSWKVSHPSGLVGSETRGLVMSNPLPPFGTTLIAQPWPFSPSPEGLYAYTSLTTHPDGRSVQDGAYVRWGAVRGTRIEDQGVEAGGAVVARADTPAQARRWGELLAALAKVYDSARGEAVEKAMERSLDRTDAGRRLADLAEHGKPVRWAGVALWVHVFLVCPWVGATYGLMFTWLWLLLPILGLMWTTAGLYWRAHRRLHGEEAPGRAQISLLAATVPTVAMRAHDYLARPLLAGLHPLAAARASLGDDEFRGYARRVMLDLRQPIRPECRAEDPAKREAERWARERWRAAVETFLRTQTMDLAGLVAPPEAKDATSKSYCPRCDAQHAISEGTCSSCGIALEPVGPAAPAV